jgi:hypothetical protein
MRRTALSLFVALAAVSPLWATEPGRPVVGSPAELHGVRFYDRDFAAKVQSGAFNPFEFVDHRPVSVAFTSPGQLEIDWGQETEMCGVRATGGPLDFELLLDCSGTPRTARWTWLEPGRARTDLAYDDPEVMFQLPQSFDQLRIEHEARFAERKLSELAGTYRDLEGNLAILGADGIISLAGGSYRVSVLECLNRSGPAAMPHVPCLRLETGRGPVVLGALPADAGAVLVEGEMLDEEQSPEGRAFRPHPDARRYFRQL